MRAVVFDMDGLMFNTEDVYTAVGTELLRRRGHAFTAELKDAMMGLRPQPTFEAMIRHCNLSDTWQQLAAESNRLFLGLLGDRLAPMPGLLELLDALERAGVPKAIATSSRRELVDACLQPFDMRKTVPVHPHRRRRRPRQAPPGDLPDGGPAFRGAAGRNGGAGGQPERLPGGGLGRGIRRGRAGRAQPATRLPHGLAGGRQPGRPAGLRGVGNNAGGT